MNDIEIERLAERVVSAYELTVPIDLEHICNEEGIILAPAQYSASFHGRIEFLPSEAVFVIYFRQAAASYLGRARFSIAHELGHYFIEEHREIIQQQRVHNSIGAFRPVRDRIEDEADKFAAALLLPGSAIKTALGTRGFLNLSGILKLADRCKTSAQAAAFRYVRLADEPCVAVVSKADQILYSFSSDEADARGFKWLGNWDVPEKSQARKCSGAEVPDVLAGHSHTADWFSERRTGAKLWEESVTLGPKGYVLTLLTWPEYKTD